MKIVKKIKKTKYLTRKSKILLGLGLGSSILGILGISVAVSYGLAVIKKNSYNTTIADLNRLAQKINGLSFNAQKISPFSTYASLKKEWKNLESSEKSGEFFDFYTLNYKRLQPYKLPNGIWAEFLKVEPDDANQQFNVEFVLKSFNGSRVIKSDIKSEKVAISPNSTFFLENFYQALEIDLKNISPYSNADKGKKNPKNWLASDFLTEINSRETAQDAIKRIRDFFNFDFDSVLKNKNFAIKYKDNLIFPYKIEILKNDDDSWIKPSQLNPDFLEIQGRVSFTDQAKKLFPKSFNTNITKNFSFLLLDLALNKSAFADPKVFIRIPKLVEPKIDEFSSENPQEKIDLSQKSIFWIYNFLKYKEDNISLKTPEEAKNALNSLLNNDLELDFSQNNNLEPNIKEKFEYQLLVDKINFNSDQNSSFINIPFEISYPLDSDKKNKLKTETQVLLRKFKNSSSLDSTVFDPKNFSSLPIVNLKFISEKNRDKDDIFEAFETVSKFELERLLNLNQQQQIYQILTDPTKFNLTFPEKEILDAWISSYNFPSVQEFSRRTLVAKKLEDGSQSRPFFENSREFIAFTKKILSLEKAEAKKYIEPFFEALKTEISEKESKKLEKEPTNLNQKTEKNSSTTAISSEKNEKPEKSMSETPPELVKVQQNQPKTEEEPKQETDKQEKPNNQKNPEQAKDSKEKEKNGNSSFKSPNLPAEKSSDSQDEGPKTDRLQQENEQAAFNDKIVSILQNQYEISLIKNLTNQIEALKNSPEKQKVTLDAASFTDLFIETYKSNDLVSQFDSFAAGLNYKIVFVANQDDEIIDQVQLPEPGKSKKTEKTPDFKEESEKKELENKENSPAVGQKSDQKISLSFFQEEKNNNQNQGQKESDKKQQTPKTTQENSQNLVQQPKPEQETEIFKLGYYYIFTAPNSEKIVFRTPIKSLKLKVFLAEKGGITLEKLSYNMLNFPQSLLKLELADSNFTSAEALKKQPEDILKAEFSSQDKDFKATMTSFKKLFGNKTFMKIYPLLSGNGLIYKANSVFKDKFGNLKIRFAVKDLDASEKKQIVFPNILEPELEKKEQDVRPKATEAESKQEKQEKQEKSQLASDSSQTSTTSSQNQENNQKNQLEIFKPAEKEAKYPLVFTVIKPNRQFRRN